MKAHNNDNKDPFETLGAATLRVLQKLNKQDEHGSSDGREPKKDEEHAEERAKYINQRVSEIAQFEKRAPGIVPHRRSRPNRR